MDEFNTTPDWRKTPLELAFAHEDKSLVTLMQFTGLKDKNGKDIYEGDILEFTDKWEWYSTKYFAKFHFSTVESRPTIQDEYDAEPLERRVVEIPSCYEQFSQGELTSYWQIIGNIHQNSELLK